MNSKELVAYQCSGCRRIHVVKTEADRCCECLFCHGSTEGLGSVCRKCKDERDEQRRVEARAAAKLDENGEVFFDDSGSRFFFGREEVIAYYTEMNPELTPPERLWVCHSTPLAFDFEQRFSEEIDSDFGYSANIPPADIERIQKIIDAYLKKWGVVGWQPGEYAIETQAILEASKD